MSRINVSRDDWMDLNDECVELRSRWDKLDEYLTGMIALETGCDVYLEAIEEVREHVRKLCR